MVEETGHMKMINNCMIFEVRDFKSILSFDDKIPLIELSHLMKNSPSKGELKSLVSQGGLRVDDKIIFDVYKVPVLGNNRFTIVTRGKLIKSDILCILTSFPINNYDYIWSTSRDGKKTKWY